jgi:SAM-dependent methyltransferase
VSDGARPGTARYDRRYFDHWYRDEGFGDPARLARKVGYAVGAAEYLFEHPVRSVLDVGCGEGPWQPALKRLRPHARYVGVDPSTYAVERYGRRRNLRLGGLADLHTLGMPGPFDLVVCSDVVAYAPAAAVRRGLATMASALGGVALIEVFVAGDEFEGDEEGYHRRPAATYERWFAEAGLHRVGPHLYATNRLVPRLAQFERG